LFSGAKLFLDGQLVKRTGGAYAVLNDDGREVKIRLKTNLADPVPVLLLNGETVRVARRLTWYEYAWISVPILLLFVGGALGGGIGGFATYTNSHLMRSDRSPGARYLLTGAISIAAVVAFIVTVAALRSSIAPR
jgi:hypothetical protein